MLFTIISCAVPPVFKIVGWFNLLLELNPVVVGRKVLDTVIVVLSVKMVDCEVVVNAVKLVYDGHEGKLDRFFLLAKRQVEQVGTSV